jgi:hypothetical protein
MSSSLTKTSDTELLRRTGQHNYFRLETAKRPGASAGCRQTNRSIMHPKHPAPDCVPGTHVLASDLRNQNQ